MKYLWFHDRLPAPCIVEETDLDRVHPLEKFGYLSDDKLYCSRYDCKKIDEEEK